MQSPRLPWSVQSTERIRIIATVYGTKRKPIGKVTPHRSGSIAAFDEKRRRLGLFTSADLAIAAILDLAKRPIELEARLAWVEELLVKETVADGTATHRIDADLL